MSRFCWPAPLRIGLLCWRGGWTDDESIAPALPNIFTAKPRMLMAPSNKKKRDPSRPSFWMEQHTSDFSLGFLFFLWKFRIFGFFSTSTREPNFLSGWPRGGWNGRARTGGVDGFISMQECTAQQLHQTGRGRSGRLEYPTRLVCLSVCVYPLLMARPSNN